MTHNPPTIEVDFYGDTVTLGPDYGYYGNGRLAIDFIDVGDTYENFGTVTVNMPDAHLNDGEVAIKHWSENAPLVEALVKAGWLVDTGRELSSGFVFPKVMTLGPALAADFDAWKLNNPTA